MVRRVLVLLAVFALAACAHAPATSLSGPPPAAAGHSDAPELMSRLVGDWVLAGDIAGQSVVHDVDADWALQGNYVRISEIARERDDSGKPLYEATIFVGWLESARHYVCIWLDNTEVASGGVSCVAAPAPDSLPFEFRDEHGTLLIATTFVYHRADDSWTWQIDNIQDGRATRFADLTLRRR